MVIGASLAGASVSRTDNRASVLSTTVSRIMAAYTNLVIWSDESSSTLSQTTRRVFVWRTPTEAFHVDCLVPTVKHGGGSMMVWAAISSRGLRSLIVLRGMITGDHYRSILADHLHPMLQTLFPGERPVFQDHNAPVHTSHCVDTCLHEHDDVVEHLTWCPQSPDFNIIESLWGYLENKVRAWFPPPRALFDLETVLHEGWVQIPVNFVQDYYFSIPRRMPAVIQAKGGPTTY
ncbi:transposable element Tcb1 transposase [Trichonephila clavipes]|nr:transposable element Tcb1 transposase [Trichonephila clavipes]